MSFSTDSDDSSSESQPGPLANDQVTNDGITSALLNDVSRVMRSLASRTTEFDPVVYQAKDLLSPNNVDPSSTTRRILRWPIPPESAELTSSSKYVDVVPMVRDSRGDGGDEDDSGSSEARSEYGNVSRGTMDSYQGRISSGVRPLQRDEYPSESTQDTRVRYAGTDVAVSVDAAVAQLEQVLRDAIHCQLSTLNDDSMQDASHRIDYTVSQVVGEVVETLTRALSMRESVARLASGQRAMSRGGDWTTIVRVLERGVRDGSLPAATADGVREACMKFNTT